MRYKIREIPDEGKAINLVLDRPFLDEALSALGVDVDRSSVAVNARLNVAGESIVLRGRVKGKITMPCGACIEPVEISLTAPLNVTFVPEGEEDDEREEDSAVLDDFEVSPHDGQYIEIAQLIRENLILNLPYAPRCREGCRGLCSTCGANRNEVDCGHTEKQVDPRLSALSKLKLS